MICPKHSDCWAVGDYENGSGAYLNEVLHFNGRKWSVVKTPDPAGKRSDDFNGLEGVACNKASDCWAVGESQKSGAAELNEVLHFNGKKWSYVSTPQPSTAPSEFGNPLISVSCTSAGDCWAVGYYFNMTKLALFSEALHFNGKKWSHVLTPQPGGSSGLDGLFGVTCVEALDCFWHGGPSLATLTNVVLRWNGTKWKTE